MVDVKEKLRKNLSSLKESVKKEMTAETLIESFGADVKDLKEDNKAATKLFEALLEDNKMASQLIEGLLKENEETKNELQNVGDVLDKLITFLIDLRGNEMGEEPIEEVPEEVPEEPVVDEEIPSDEEEVKENSNTADVQQEVSTTQQTQPQQTTNTEEEKKEGNCAPAPPVQTESGLKGDNKSLKETVIKKIEREKSLTKLF